MCPSRKGFINPKQRKRLFKFRFFIFQPNKTYEALIGFVRFILSAIFGFTVLWV